MDDITPLDNAEKRALGIGHKISIAAGIVSAAGVTLCAALGGYAWIADNLPLLISGLAAIAGGAASVYVAARRMYIGRGRGGTCLLTLSIGVAAFIAAIMVWAAAAGETFSGTFRATTTWQHAKTVGAATLTETLPTLYTWTHADGTNDWQMDAFVSSSSSLPAEATNAVNLAAAVNGFGDAVAFSRVAFLALPYQSVREDCLS
jgi:hypothetical protein